MAKPQFPINKTQSWVKKELLFEPCGPDYSHGSHPCAVHIAGDQFILAYTQRDANSRSHVVLTRATVAEGKIRLTAIPRVALHPGNYCHFDCDGVISVCFVKHLGSIYLYYVGWQNLPDGLWTCDTGRAVMDSETTTLTRQFNGPVLGRDKTNPLFAAATAFHVTKARWQTWYNSGIRWEKTDTGWKHYYGIHYAHSLDGLTWECEPDLVIPFADEYEYAFGRPSVLKIGNRYNMWFAHRATKAIDTYRIGFAYSTDGREWIRNDSLAGIDVSPAGWDSEMICYPSVFEHDGLLYMLYNGNGYGRTGFGYAVWDQL